MTRSLMLSFAAVTLFATAASARGHGRLHAACGADIEKSCKDAGHGKATFECLKAHHDELSDSCKAFLDQHAQADEPTKQ